MKGLLKSHWNNDLLKVQPLNDLLNLLGKKDKDEIKIDISLLLTKEEIFYFIKDCQINRYPIIYIKINDWELEDWSIEEAIKELFFTNQLFPSLHTVIINNTVLTLQSVDPIFALINPKRLRSELKVLSLNNCSLLTKGISQLFEELKENFVLEEIHIAGNECRDISMQKMSDFFLSYDNNVLVLDVSNNKLSDEGLQIINGILNHSKCKLNILNLSNNPLIKGICFEDTILAIMQFGHITQLNLSKCNIHSCGWARYLPYLRSLYYLNLSHNHIDDKSLLQLSYGLTNSFTLQELDLSYNLFKGHYCSVLQTVFEQNHSISFFSLQGNRLEDIVWHSLQQGLSNNQVLLTLNVQDCGLTITTAKILCSCLSKNNILTLKLDQNKLPIELISNPREYYSKELCALPKSVHAEVDSMNSRQPFCETKYSELKLSLESLSIVDDQNKSNIDNLLESKKIYSSSIWRKEVVEQTSGYFTKEKFDLIIQDMDLAYTSEKRFVEICYGRDTYKIGEVEIDTSITYLRLRELITPLVKEHLQTVDKSELDNFSNFLLFDPSGNVVDNQQALTRIVWHEVYKMETPRIVIRSKTWIQLS